MVDGLVGRWRMKVPLDLVKGLVGSKRLIMPDKLHGIDQSEPWPLTDHVNGLSKSG
jgi:hypothetical protein